jgi:Pyruvate/2-oxoacid:ferredoxin oxidoreductase delta subunit/bacterioferritin-associated ferredoxin
MRLITLLAKVDKNLCTGCRTCEFVCPTYAIEVKQKKSEVDAGRCTGCWNCENRCPEYCISMADREPFMVKTDPLEVDQDQLRALCAKAKLHPKQTVCYCTGTKAEEVAAAILKGAKSVGDVGLMTGAGTGCGSVCLQSLLRLLEAAGIRHKPTRKGFQDYFRINTIFEIPEKLFKKYPNYRFAEDKKLFEKMVK